MRAHPCSETFAVETGLQQAQEVVDAVAAPVPDQHGRSVQVSMACSEEEIHCWRSRGPPHQLGLHYLGSMPRYLTPAQYGDENHYVRRPEALVGEMGRIPDHLAYDSEESSGEPTVWRNDVVRLALDKELDQGAARGGKQ